MFIWKDLFTVGFSEAIDMDPYWGFGSSAGLVL